MAFYKALDFTFNPQFTDDTAACIVISEHNYAMLLTHEKFKSFATKPIPMLTRRPAFWLRSSTPASVASVRALLPRRWRHAVCRSSCCQVTR